MSDRGIGDVDPTVPPGGAGAMTDIDAVLTPDVEPAVPAGQVYTPPPSIDQAGTDSGGKASEAKDQAKEQASQAAGQAKEVAQTAKQETQQVAATAAEGARDVAHEASEQLHQVAQDASVQARELLHQATGELKTQAGAQTERAAGGLHTLAGQIEALVDGRPEEAGPVADYARQLNGKVEEFASRLEQRGPEGLLDDVQRFARRRPGAFLAGAAAAGFIASRFFRGNQAAQDQGTGGGRGDAAVPRSDIDLRGDLYPGRPIESEPRTPVTPPVPVPEVEARRQYGSI